MSVYLSLPESSTNRQVICGSLGARASPLATVAWVAWRIKWGLPHGSERGRLRSQEKLLELFPRRASITDESGESKQARLQTN
jgi:hypothetical protein